MTRRTRDSGTLYAAECLAISASRFEFADAVTGAARNGSAATIAVQATIRIFIIGAPDRLTEGTSVVAKSGQNVTRASSISRMERRSLMQ
jgi:hypothetical protein